MHPKDGGRSSHLYCCSIARALESSFHLSRISPENHSKLSSARGRKRASGDSILQLFPRSARVLAPRLHWLGISHFGAKKARALTSHIEQTTIRTHSIHRGPGILWHSKTSAFSHFLPSIPGFSRPNTHSITALVKVCCIRPWCTSLPSHLAMYM